MAHKAKRQKILYKEDDDEHKVAELEDFLFGNTASVFGANRDGDDDSEGLNIRELVQQGDGRDVHGAESGSDGDGEEDPDEQRRASGAQAGARVWEDRAGAEADDIFVFDTAGAQHGVESDSNDAPKGAKQQQGQQAQQQQQRRPAWQDPHDAQVKVDVKSSARLRKLRSAESQQHLSGAKYEAALRKQHQALNPRTSWAKAKRRAGSVEEGIDAELGAVGGDDNPDAEQLLRTAGGLLAPRSALLPPGVIELTRLRDANQHEPSNAAVQSVQFHPNGQVLLTAGLDKKLRLFSVDGVRNPKLQSVYLQDLPLHQASFVSGGAQVIASGRRPFVYLFDLASSSVERLQGPSGGAAAGAKSLEAFACCPADAEAPTVAFFGDQGHVPLLSLRSRQWVGSLKMNGSVRCGAFSSDGRTLITAGGDGVLYTWDMRTRRCLHQQVDEGSFNTSCLAASADGGYLATGSASGVVNVYSGRDGSSLASSSSSSSGRLVRPSQQKPLRALLNLTTAVDSLAFNGDGQLLVMGSRMKKDALRVVHLPSLTVFSNWPTSKTPLHYVHSLAFSPNSGYLALGNAKGRVLLYRLHHYSSA